MTRHTFAGLGRAALTSGALASFATFLGLAIAAAAEGAAPLRPINATSHWLNGGSAGLRGDADLRHTAVGAATNHAACLFWALPFTAWQRVRPARTGAALARDAVAVAVVAAAVDYGATPKRFTPGWELVLSKGGMAIAYASLAAGLAAGTWLDGPRHRRRRRADG